MHYGKENSYEDIILGFGLTFKTLDEFNIYLENNGLKTIVPDNYYGFGPKKK